MRRSVRWLVGGMLGVSVVAGVGLTVGLLVAPVSLPGVETTRREGQGEGLASSVARVTGGSANVARVVLGGELPEVAGARLERVRPRQAGVPLGVATVAVVVGGGLLALGWHRRSGGGAGIVRLTAVVGVAGSMVSWPEQALRVAGLPGELCSRLVTRWVDEQALRAGYWSAVVDTAPAQPGGVGTLLRPLVEALTLLYVLPLAGGVLAAALLAVCAQIVLAVGVSALAVELPRVLYREGARSLGRRLGVVVVGAIALGAGLAGVVGLLWATAWLRSWPVLPAWLGPLELLPRVGAVWLVMVALALGIDRVVRRR